MMALGLKCSNENFILVLLMRIALYDPQQTPVAFKCDLKEDGVGSGAVWYNAV